MFSQSSMCHCKSTLNLAISHRALLNFEMFGVAPPEAFQLSPVPFDLKMSVKLEILSPNPQALPDPLLLGACSVSSYLLNKDKV